MNPRACCSGRDTDLQFSLRMSVCKLCICFGGSFCTKFVSEKLNQDDERRDKRGYYKSLREYSQKSIATDAAEKYHRLLEAWT
jgi:hypothetical protein